MITTLTIKKGCSYTLFSSPSTSCFQGPGSHSRRPISHSLTSEGKEGKCLILSLPKANVSFSPFRRQMSHSLPSEGKCLILSLPKANVSFSPFRRQMSHSLPSEGKHLILSLRASKFLMLLLHKDLRILSHAGGLGGGGRANGSFMLNPAQKTLLRSPLSASNRAVRHIL